MYAKVFRSLFYGSLTAQPDPQLVLVCLLAHSDADGNVELPASLISGMTGLPLERVRVALELLEAPDPDSRSGELDGRRIDPAGPGRWSIVNYVKYRGMRDIEQRRSQTREAVAKYRNKNVSRSKPAVSRRKPLKAQAEVEAEAQAEAEDQGGLPSPLNPPAADDAGDTAPASNPDQQRRNVARLIGALARTKAMPKPPRDWRPRAWEDAQAIAEDKDQAHVLMAFVGWLRKQGHTDPVVHQRVMRYVVQGQIANPHAYFTDNGVALNSIVGEVSVLRAENEKRKIAAEEARFLSEMGS